MSEVISRAEWMKMLHRSQDLLASLRFASPRERETIWQELGPLNRRIRSRGLLVKGIDIP